MPAETVRDWRLRFRSRAELVAAHFWRWARALDGVAGCAGGRARRWCRCARGDRRVHEGGVAGAWAPGGVVVGVGADGRAACWRSTRIRLGRRLSDRDPGRLSVSRTVRRRLVHDRAQEIGLFRWRLVARGGRSVALGAGARRAGAVVGGAGASRARRAVGAGVAHHAGSLDPGVSAWAGSRRWSRRRGGWRTKTPERLLELACALRREQPARTAAQIDRIIVEAEGSSPTARTIQRHLAAAGLAVEGRADRRARWGASRPSAATSCGPGTRCTAR